MPCRHYVVRLLAPVQVGPTGDRAASVDTSGIPSIASVSTAEWRAQHERDGRVDLWLEDEFNAGSRLVVSPGDARCLSSAA